MGNFSPSPGVVFRQYLFSKDVFRGKIAYKRYRTSIVNALFSENYSFSNERKALKKGLPTENDEESSLVAGVVLLG